MVARRGNPSEVDREVSYNADTIATIQQKYKQYTKWPPKNKPLSTIVVKSH